MAAEYGLTVRQLRRKGGYETYSAMTPEARGIVLRLKDMGIAKADLMRGGLRARGFYVRNNNHD